MSQNLSLQVQALANVNKTSPLVAFLMVRDNCTYAQALRTAQDHLSNPKSPKQFGAPMTHENMIWRAMKKTRLSYTETEFLINITPLFYEPTPTELKRQNTGPWARHMVMYGWSADHAEQVFITDYMHRLETEPPRHLQVIPFTYRGKILDMMRQYNTCALVAYYMVELEKSYPEAILYSQQHSRLLSPSESELPEVRKGSLSTGLPESVIRTLVELEPGEHFDEPTPHEQLALHTGPWAEYMLRYGWSKEDARRYFIQNYISSLQV